MLKVRNTTLAICRGSGFSREYPEAGKFAAEAAPTKEDHLSANQQTVIPFTLSQSKGGPTLSQPGQP
jgi:hypothetical protein